MSTFMLPGQVQEVMTFLFLDLMKMEIKNFLLKRIYIEIV
ncbi:hypothetical protein LEP1GSC075_1523 [Leptospira interrogans str. Kito]|nr:hypothetical protein LEP1GSC069_1073 [Leptospira interrogans serovar Canicola str. Fiocruz LV133]EMK18555.1 hypothetical protein LEP1GSC075_1523 [Leptospira interrogans str. Kito]EMN77979.1 hypothetical protein LEP1GSC102_2699 [Leptospira interrogans str. UI 09600]